MPVSERAHLLIQKHFDGLAAEAELAELHELLVGDPETADAFAAAARLQTGLESHFRKQYKIDQVANLLTSSGTTAAEASAESRRGSGEPAQCERAATVPFENGSTFVPAPARPTKSRRARLFNSTSHGARGWKKWIVAALLLASAGLAITFSRSPGASTPRLISGEVTVAGRAATRIPDNAQFEVAGKEAAVIEVAGTIRIELAPAARAVIRRESGRAVVQLVSGKGEFHVQPNHSAIRVETALGIVTTTDGQFSLELVTPVEQFSSTSPVQGPGLAVVVAFGSVTVEHGGISTTLTAGQHQVFFSQT